MDEEVVVQKPAYELNEGQSQSFDWLLDFIQGRTPYRKALLEGYAGTGKTFLINRVIEKILEVTKGQLDQVNFGVTAPTHKAVRVLKKQSELKNRLDFGTIHSFLALKQKINQKTGEVSYEKDFKANQERRIDSIDVLLVDESSMLDDLLFEYIEDEQRSGNLKVIYMGDPIQIPPVGKKEQTGEGTAKPFIPSIQKSLRIHPLVLTEPQRQAADSPIIMYAHTIRNNVFKKHIPFEFKEEHKHALEVIPRDLNVLNEIFKLFKTPEFEADQDYIKVIAWRNDTVKYFNNHIRLLINEATSLPKIILNEKLVLFEPMMKKDRILLPNNEEVIVTYVEVRDIEVKYRFRTPGNAFNATTDDHNSDERIFKCKVYAVKLRNPENFVYEAFILHEDFEREYEILREKIRQAALKATDNYDRSEMWRQFYGIAQNFVWANYNYATTAHKSQGSTYDYAISMEWDIEQNPDIEERNRIRYVASTRSRHKLFIVK